MISAGARSTNLLVDVSFSVKGYLDCVSSSIDSVEPKPDQSLAIAPASIREAPNMALPPVVAKGPPLQAASWPAAWNPNTGHEVGDDNRGELSDQALGECAITPRTCHLCRCISKWMRGLPLYLARLISIQGLCLTVPPCNRSRAVVQASNTFEPPGWKNRASQPQVPVVPDIGRCCAALRTAGLEGRGERTCNRPECA